MRFLVYLSLVISFYLHGAQGQLFSSGGRRKRQVVFGGTDTATYADCRTPDGSYGYCTRLQECGPMVNLLALPSPAALAFLRKSICGYQGFEPKVCCSYFGAAGVESTTPFVFGGGDVVTTARPPTPSKPTTGSYSALPDSCGYTNATRIRIVGGIEAPMGAWPWITLLGFRDPNNGKVEYLCGGALITDQHVITAAHCVKDKDDLYSVRVGEHDVNSEKDGASPQEIRIAAKMPHEKFDSVSFQNDIAILKLSQKVKLTPEVQPICLPKEKSISNRNFDKTKPFVAGWGATSFNGPSSGTLKEVQIPVVTKQSCTEAYKKFRTVVVDESVICAGTARGGIDACQGDSGGPLMLSEAERFYLVGVVSFGFKCAEPGYPGVYTRITHYMDWIASKL